MEHFIYHSHQFIFDFETYDEPVGYYKVELKGYRPSVTMSWVTPSFPMNQLNFLTGQFNVFLQVVKDAGQLDEDKLIILSNGIFTTPEI